MTHPAPGLSPEPGDDPDAVDLSAGPENWPSDASTSPPARSSSAPGATSASAPVSELPGMWEEADFLGGAPDTVRGPVSSAPVVGEVPLPFP